MAIVMVHGFPLDARMWREVPGVLAVDLPGFGSSTDEPARSIDAMADAVMAAADAQGLGKFTLGGMSMGGYVCFSAWRNHADRIERLILCDTRAEPDSDTARAGRLADAARAEREGTGFYVDRQRDLMFGEAPAPALVAEVEGWMRSVPAATFTAALRAMGARADARPLLAGITVPTLVVVGREDKITPEAGMRAMAATIPNATVAVVPGGHLAALEGGAETAAAIAAFLRSP